MSVQDSSQSYPQLLSSIGPGDAVFAENYKANIAAVEKLEIAQANARQGGSARHRARHLAKGKLLPRERVELLLDPGSHFLELCPLAGLDVEGHTPGAAIIGGIGIVSGVECLISASDATVKGGAISELGVSKTLRLAEIARENHLPTLSLTESAGADLPNQSKIFVPGGESFRNLTRASKRRAPTISMVFGSSTAGGAYVPGMSDYSIMVKDQAQVYLAGPPLVKMATGEDTDHESLGGAAMHAKLSGVCDYLAEDERDAIRLAREVVAHLQWKKQGLAPRQEVLPPIYRAEDILGIASSDLRRAFDPREVIARSVDASRFSEFKPLYGSTLVCGWAHIHGYPVGILANNGILFSEAANKGAQFIQLCNQRNTPLVFLQNITGFMVGKKYEQEGIIKNGAKLINAVSNSTVPAITLMMGASYGAGNYGMCGRAYAPRFLFSWPNHRIAVMGGPQLAGVLDLIQRSSAKARGTEVDEEALSKAKSQLEAQIERESDAFYSTARLWDDAIIDPRLTRDVLGIALSTCCNAEVKGTTSWGVFRH